VRRATHWRALAAATVTGWLLLAAAPAAACSVCFGSRDNGSPLVTGARLGVLLLLGVTVAVLGGLTRFFFHLRARARRAESEGIAAEWADLQRSASS
jgi:hypothetical protein